MELLQLVHQIGHSWGPVIVVKMYGLEQEAQDEYRKIQEDLTVGEILALQLAVGTSIMAKGSADVARCLFNEDHPLQLLTLIIKTGNRYDRVKRIFALFLQEELSMAPKDVFERENQLLLWVYNAIIQLSGILEDAQRVCPRNRQGCPEEVLSRLVFAGTEQRFS